MNNIYSNKNARVQGGYIYETDMSGKENDFDYRLSGIYRSQSGVDPVEKIFSCNGYRDR